MDLGKCSFRATDTNAPLVQQPTCTPVEDVSLADVGDTLCVYAIVKVVGHDDTAQYTNFRDSDFQLITCDLIIAIPHQSGECIEVRGTIKKLGAHPAAFSRQVIYTGTAGNEGQVFAEGTVARTPRQGACASGLRRPNQSLQGTAAYAAQVRGQLPVSESFSKQSRASTAAARLSSTVGGLPLGSLNF